MQGSECKACDPPSDGSPHSLPVSLKAGSHALFSAMAEEQEVCPVPELEEAHSSTEDLLSIDVALQGTEYYRDLGYVPSVEMTSWVPPASRSQEKLPGELVVPQLLEPGYFLQSPHGLRPGDQGAEPFPMLARSVTTSRRHSWERPLSPLDERRLSLDISDMGSDEERSLPRTFASHSLNLPGGGLQAWAERTGHRAAIKGRASLELPYISVEEARSDTVEQQECDSSWKRLRSRSVPQADDMVSLSRISENLEISILLPKVLNPLCWKELKKTTSPRSCLDCPASPSGAQAVSWSEYESILESLRLRASALLGSSRETPSEFGDQPILHSPAQLSSLTSSMKPSQDYSILGSCLPNTYWY
ncbi:rho guanine nucleotide exchange factor 18-like [Dromiciops gliroides]|uniref:rho guanine nucleotide exchange factor 18-like n=1 Tax=Dromiciops gliroides TaxID=33562 RepID=UPI001CC4F397|nr:rho guanine nucleotide exchange factor 18-like [Dromiciops gliroides]